MPFARMNHRYRLTHRFCHVLLLISLLCAGNMLHMLGMPLTFWDLDGSCDLVEDTMLEGLAILSAIPVLSPLFQSLYVSETDPLVYRRSPQALVFHPPIQMS